MVDIHIGTQVICDMLRQLHWLPVRQRIDFKVMVLVYKLLHRLTPPYLSDDCQLVTDVGRPSLRSADIRTWMVPRTQARLGDRSFGVAGPRLWNNLPVELRQQDICLTEIRQLLKTFLFRWNSAHCDFFVLMAPGISTLTYLLTYLLMYNEIQGMAVW